jgi:hypothetical protein
MPVTFVRDPVTGITYSVNISGSTPTEQESARIDQFLASQRTLSVLPQAQPVEEEEIDRTAFGRGFVREPFQRERSFGVVEEALADTAFGKFFGFDAEEARAKQEAAEAELRRLELEDPSIRFEDITGLGTAASVSGEALGGEARDIAIQAGATATGAGIGGLFFGAGAVPGAAIGRTAGVAYTTAQAAPQMLAEAIEAQKEEGNEVNLTKALGATAINLLSEFVTDYFVVGKLIPKEAKSKVGSAVRSAIEAGTAEGATEVFQQAVIRGQAGQDLTSPEAIAEYAESLYSGMTVGGTIGGVGGFLSTPDRSAEKELDDDLKELREYGLAGFKFAEETEKDIEAQRNAALGAVGIDLDAPLQIGTDGAPLALPAPDAAEIAPKPVIADTEFENLSFNKAEYERVLQQVKADITRRKPQPEQAEADITRRKPQPEQAEVDVPSSEPLSKPVSNPINIPAIHQRVKADIPGITVSKVRDIMKELQARGFVAENPASKKNKFIPMGSLTPEVKTPDVSYRRQIDSASDFIKADQTRLERLQYDLRSAEAYGRDLEGNRVTPNQVNATIARVEQRIAQSQQRIELANQRLQSLGQDTHVPRIEKVGIPPSLKAVPVAEGTPDALRPRFEAQQAGIRGMKEQVSSLNKQVRKLNEQAKKRTLSSNELDRMQKLQQQQAELSKRLGEAQANLKAPEKIVQEAKGEQFREQERQREIERKLAAARARAAADQVKAQEDQGVSPVTPAFNAKQTRVFDALKKRLSNLGLKDVKLEGVQKIEGGEGFFDPVTKTITLAMGMYDPNMNDQQLFDAISEVMNHEVIHALRAMGVLKPNEMKVLERLAEKTKYVKRTKDGTQKRNYTYLDRAKSLYSDYTPTQQKEEAIAEMFRDYIAGRLKLGGGPRSLFEKIKKFFKSLIGANVDNGFNSVEDIFQGIRRGEIGARDRVAPAAPAPTPAAAPAQMQSRLAGMPKNIADSVNDLDLFLRKNPSKSEIENHPAILRIVEDMSSRPETVNNPNYGSASWHSNRSYEVSGVPVVGTGRLLPIIVEEAIRLPYVETGTSLSMPERGRKAFVLIGPPAAGKSTIANELAIVNKAAIPDADQVKSFIPEYAGGIGAAAVHEESVELLAEAQKSMVNEGYNLVAQKVGHSDKSIRNLIKSLKESDYDVSLVNMHVDPDEAFRRMIGRFIRTGRIIPPSYFNSIGNSPRLVYNNMKEEGIADGYAEIDNNGGLNEPKRILDISGKNPLSGSQFDPERGGARTEQSFARTRQPGTGRVVPQTAREQLNAAVSTSDDYMPDAPAEQRPLFSRIPRSPSVGGLRDFIRKNPDGFTIDATTFDPAAGGFVVAPLKEAEIIVGESLPEEVLLGYLEDNKDIAQASGRTVYLGGWFDGESQQYFLDNTLIVPTAEEALYIAEAADQLAIFDLNNFEEIRTNAGIERLKQSGTYRGDAAVGYQRNLAEVGRRFAQARDQRRARIQEQLIGGLKRPLESRLFVPLTPEQRAASIIDYLDPNTGKPLFKKKAGSETLVSFANKLLELRGTRSYDIISSEEDRREVAQIMAAEAEAALLSSRDALGWYDSTLKLAKQILYPVYPEISPTRPDGTPNSMHDPAAEHAFDYATAVTSNGLAVVDNYQFASEQYDAWKASPDGKFTVVGKGDQGGSMLKAFEFWNALVDRGYNSSQAAELLTTQLPRSEVNRVLKDVFGVTRQNDLPAKADTKEEASTIVSIAYVIGPKIGNGFYQNLRGNFDPLTMDRWWMRFVNRITGNPLVVYTEEGLGKSLDRVWNLVKNPKGLSKMEREMLRRAQENLNMTKLEKSDTALLSGEIEKVWNSTFNKAYNDKLRELLDEGMDFEIVRGSVRGPMAAEAKRLARQARPAKPELALASTNLTKKVKPALEEAPRDALDRTAMRDVANRARRILRENNQIAANLTNADFQALMWYAEKRIFDAGGVKRGRGEDNDYADGAIAIAKKKGISNAKIEAALPEAERVRVRSVESQLAGDQDAGSRVGELVREPQEGDFFSPRRLTLVAENDTIEANMTPQERAEIREALEGVEIDPEMPRTMYSRIPVAEAYMPTRAPVDSKAGPTPIYGSIMEDGRLLPVVLPKGSHRVYENGVEVGNGLFHIQQRQHDRELIENSKYKRVENSIYDLMRRWQNQGYDDGESVIGYNSRDDLVLEWRNNLAFSAPPMRLVLERGSNVQGAPLADAYYVKTFFLILDKEDRAAPERRNQKRRLYSRLYSTTAQLAPQVQQKKQNLTYARSADFLAKGLGVVLPKNKAQETADTFLRKFQDNMLPVGRMIQELQAKGLTITDAMDTYLKEELFHGIVGEKITRREETIYKNALDAVKGFNITSGMIDGLQAVSDTASPGRDGFVKQARETARSEKLALAEAYLYAKHAKERNAYIRTINPNLDSGSGMTDAEADAILRWFTGLDAGNTAAVRALDAATRKIVEDTNNVRVESGLIPSEFDQVLDEDGDVIERPNYNFYVPLRGIVDPEAAESDGTAARAGSGQRFGGKGRPDPRALGRYKYATDVLATLINQNQQSVSRGERNKVGQSFLQLLRADPATTKAYAEILPRTPTRRALVGKRVREITDFNAAQDPNIFVVKEDGKDVYVELSDVNLGAALKGDNGLGAGALGSIVRTMGKINRYLANINTSYNPEFFITNFLRDLQTAGVNIQQFDGDGLTTQIVKDVRSALGGIKRSIRNKDDSSEWSQIYKDFVSAGGQNVTNQMSTVADQMENIRGLVGDVADQGARGKWNQVKNSFVGKGAGSFLSFIEDYNTVIENGIRVATYKALLDRGFTRERAAQAARNVTVNFAKGGEYKNFMNAFYLFYNASLQGSFAMLNAALRSRKVQRIWAGVIAAGLLQDQLNALLSEEEEDGLKQYDKIPDYILHHNFILPDPFGLTERSYIAIPMPYGLNMAHNIGRATSRALRGGYDAGEATSSIVGTIVDTINPLGGTENFANFFAPTVVDPFIDVMQNEDFAGKPIFKEAFPGDRSPESQRYWSTTNPSAIWVAQNINSLTGGTSAIPGFIDLSPDVMNFWLEFATGGVGRFVQRTAELPVRVFDEGLDEEIYREIPFVRKIIGSVSSREDYGRYIEKRDEILLAGEELKEAVDNRDRERALAARERFAEELRYLPRVRAIDNAIRKVNRQMNQVRDNRNLSDERRREIMDRLDERKQLLILRGNQFLADY